MSAVARNPVPDRHASGQARAARRFFLLALGVVATAGLVATSMARIWRPAPAEGVVFPPVFVLTTLLLAAGSFALHRALAAVRHERQREFRRWLLGALACGTLFIGLQAYGFWTLFPAQRSASETSLGAAAFILVFTMLHAMHFSVAVLAVTLVVVRAFGNRYDHEYHWGVRACGWFWHALGVAWVAVLAVLAISL